jgi:hypothetical protein
MAGGVYQNTVQDDAGNIVPGASILVRTEAGGATATIYSDAALSVGQSNPIIADANGKFRFYAAAGKYRITVTYGIYTDDLRNVPLGEAQERDTGTASAQVVTIAIGDARYLVASGNLAALTDPAAARVNLGLGTMAVEDAADYTPTSGLGTMAFQDDDAVAITGGSIVIDSLYVQGDSFFGGIAGDTVGDYSVEIREVTDARNHLVLVGGETGDPVTISAEGMDTDVDITLTPKGAGVALVIGAASIQSGNLSLVVGADQVANTLTDATNKGGRIGVPHYLIAEEPVCVFNVSNVSGMNTVGFGGGTSLMNAASVLAFRTAATTTTLTGTIRMQIGPDGHVRMGPTLPTDDTVNALQLNGSMTVSTGNAYKVNNVQVVNARKTGWAVATGTPTRTTFDTTTVTLPQLAERVKALIDDLSSHGLIGT